MDPSIHRFSNESFYGNLIVSAESVYHRAPLLDTPILFAATFGTAEETKHDFSSINDAGCFESCQLCLNCRPNQYIVTFLKEAQNCYFPNLRSPF